MFGKMKDWVVKLFLGKYLGSIVRHVMTVVGTYLIANNIASPDTAEEVTTAVGNLLTSPEIINLLGGLLIGGAQSASLLEKKIRDK